MPKDFESKIPLPALKFLSRIGARVGFDPLGSTEAESFLAELVHDFDSKSAEDRKVLETQIESAFRCIGERPDWIQNSAWPFGRSGPMVFVGQIQVPAQSGLIHDEAAFYVFWDHTTGETKAVLQVA